MRSFIFVVATMAAMAAPPHEAAAQAVAPTPQAGEISGPPAPGRAIAPRNGSLPAVLSLDRALDEAAARSPSLIAARAEVETARGRLAQAKLRFNPELSVEVENFAGSGPYARFRSTETTVALNQRLDLGGRRTARISVADAELAAQELRFAIARAELEKGVRVQFATALAARERLELARQNVGRARELARVAGELVAAGREPPLRAMRARAAAAQADAARSAAEVAETAARRTLAALLGAETPPAELRGGETPAPLASLDAARTLDVRLAALELAVAEAALKQERAEGRPDPSIGIGYRSIRETGDRALVASISVPFQIFDRNQGNVAAARSAVQTAAARRDGALAGADAEISNATGELDAATARLKALDEAALPEAAEALRLAELSYRAGRTSLVELLDAQDAYAAARSEQIEARLSHAVAAATLARAAADQGIAQ